MLVTVLEVPVPDADIAADRLWSAGASAVEERDVAAGRRELRTALGPDRSAAAQRLGELSDGWVLRFEDAEPAADTWREFARPVRINERLVLRPTWVEHDASDGDLVVSIDPGASFGLGDHPTTRLAADVTDRLVNAGDRVLDVGCGSGVLAIVAARRGASEVVAIDVSDAAVDATARNARVNGVEIAVSNRPLAAVVGEFELVVANILAPALIKLADDLCRVTAEHGRLVVSGVLDGHHDHVVDALAPMQLVAVHRVEGWAALELVRA